jgi:hypothetical protein
MDLTGIYLGPKPVPLSPPVFFAAPPRIPMVEPGRASAVPLSPSAGLLDANGPELCRSPVARYRALLGPVVFGGSSILVPMALVVVRVPDSTFGAVRPAVPPGLNVPRASRDNAGPTTGPTRSSAPIEFLAGEVELSGKRGPCRRDRPPKFVEGPSFGKTPRVPGAVGFTDRPGLANAVDDIGRLR